ncbi:hypothetical protein ACFCX4_18085 [Kitasatospora sp. NPDC056327]|uniref:hypothetical protein n=1 Tax=Kitasatospora sp. NPDC056327 TaxID=3345785 RepID=UPI0035D83BEA
MNSTAALALAEPGEAADLAAFLVRLLRFDKAAVVRLQGVPRPDGPGVLAVFGRLPLGGSGVLVVRTAGLSRLDAPVDLTVSAGQLLDGLDEAAGTVARPAPVTGPAWAGLLPPRTGWQPVGAPPADRVRAEVTDAVREFRERSEAVPGHHRTRAVLDALADEIWSRPVTVLPELPLRAAHAAQVIGFLNPRAPLGVHRAGGWLRLSAPAGSVALRTAAAPGAGLGLSPVRPR